MVFLKGEYCSVELEDWSITSQGVYLLASTLDLDDHCREQHIGRSRNWVPGSPSKISSIQRSYRHRIIAGGAEHQVASAEDGVMKVVVKDGRRTSEMREEKVRSSSGNARTEGPIRAPINKPRSTSMTNAERNMQFP
jgi:hypothetical protein